MPNVKGSVLLSRLDFVKANFGDEGMERLLGALLEADRNLLEGGLLAAQWYPFELGEHMDAAIMGAVAADNPETFRQLGVRSAEVNLGKVHQVFVHEGDPHGLLRRAPVIYRLYYDTGHRTYEKTGESSCRLTTYDSESYSSADCLTVIGWHERAVEMCGGQDVKIEHLLCRAKGAEVCQYDISWRSPGGEMKP